MELGYFNKYKISELRKSFFFNFYFFILKFPSYEKLATTLHFDLARFHDVTSRNLVFQLGNSRSPPVTNCNITIGLNIEQNLLLLYIMYLSYCILSFTIVMIIIQSIIKPSLYYRGYKQLKILIIVLFQILGNPSKTQLQTLIFLQIFWNIEKISERLFQS